MATIQLAKLSKNFGKTTVLEPFDLTIENGELLVLVGPSGCGKSTLLRLIAGLEQPTAGRILIDGREVENIPAKDRNIAMVFQSYALYPHLTVYDNMSLALRLRKVDKKVIETKVHEAATILGIEHLLQRRPGQLSGGQRQRVAMGRAIVRNPKAFLFDEPLSNLDAELRLKMRTEIKRLHQKLGTTTVYVTHDQVEAMTLADRMVVMQGGKIQQVGTPMELFDRPRNLFVAGFLGSPAMNFLPTEVSNGVAAIKGTDVRFPMQRLAQESGLVMGIRPSHIIRNPQKRTPLSFKARVDVVEPLGTDMLVEVQVGTHTMTVAMDYDGGLRTGDVLDLGFDPKRVHFFDRDLGNAL